MSVIIENTDYLEIKRIAVAHFKHMRISEDFDSPFNKANFGAFNKNLLWYWQQDSSSRNILFSLLQSKDVGVCLGWTFIFIYGRGLNAL